MIVGKFLRKSVQPQSVPMTSKEASELSKHVSAAQLPERLKNDLINARAAIEKAAKTGYNLAKLNYSICYDAVKILESEGYMVWRPGGFGLPYITNISFTS